ncbi:MAG: hypothetical protein J0I54_17650 [Bosea sp.]|uniref:hypothetical protein n=1 Tax=unclassified Bosea (in: a-proteobacteria) TaxID=2653178 RepID=UPI000969955C|nr:MULTISPECIES: hypothetical protein [unclassified Bosea (in: a-proteobacteria)]MBN9458458.1 hypothetical protein [Bosea sp. (in: a-proteobacteria)]OJV06840.1 MAG: hypothetical protein BGO20_00295 [Bosea sp. 67-29]
MSLNLRLALIGIIAAGVIFAGWKLVDLVAAGRVSKATETYNQENRDAADKGFQARADVRACRERGGMSWDRATGQCVRAVPEPGQ